VRIRNVTARGVFVRGHGVIAAGQTATVKDHEGRTWVATGVFSKEKPEPKPDEDNSDGGDG